MFPIKSTEITSSLTTFYATVALTKFKLLRKTQRYDKCGWYSSKEQYTL